MIQRRWLVLPGTLCGVGFALNVETVRLPDECVFLPY